jgi:hypothetical protein
MDPMSDTSDLGGDPACWAHLFDQDGREIEDPESPANPVTERRCGAEEDRGSAREPTGPACD